MGFRSIEPWLDVPQSLARTTVVRELADGLACSEHQI
jgi:hypothetical protein